MKNVSSYMHALGNPRPTFGVRWSDASEPTLMDLGVVMERPCRMTGAELTVREAISHVGDADKRTSAIQAGVVGAGAAGPYPWRCPV